jgi:hypothetical protein
MLQYDRIEEEVTINVIPSHPLLMYGITLVGLRIFTTMKLVIYIDTCGTPRSLPRHSGGDGGQLPTPRSRRIKPMSSAATPIPSGRASLDVPLLDNYIRASRVGEVPYVISLPPPSHV